MSDESCNTSPCPAEHEPSNRDLMLASPCNYEAMDAELSIKQNGGKKDEIPEQPIQGKNNRFKRLVRMILTNTIWAKEAANKTQKEQDGFKTDRGEKLRFNLNAFRSDIQTCGKLSPQSIEILSKPSSVRTDQEVKLIQKIVYRLKCFDRYPLFVKQELARVIYYDKFEDGRLIIKQGHPGSSFYFIVSGAVIVERIEFDPFINEHYTQRVGELQAGDSFGELALLHNTKRAASILCRGTSEFLRVDKPDFDEVLHTSHQREWEIRVNLLSSHPVFQGWTTRELKLVNGHSKMKNYPPNSVIVSEKKLRNDRVFFIASGHCSVVRRIDLLKKFVSKKKYKYTLPPLKTGNETNSVDTFKRLSSYSNEYMPCNNDVQLVTKRRCSKQADVLETRYFMVRELSDGDFFNVGESLEGLYVISVGRVEVVQIGTIAFSRHNGGRVLEEMKSTYLQSLLTFQEAYEKYITERRWICYKKNLVKSVAEKRKKTHSVSIKDVPGVLKQEQIYYLYQDNIL